MASAVTTTVSTTTVSLLPLSAVPAVPRSRGPGHVESSNANSSRAPSRPPTRPPSCYNTPRTERGRKPSTSGELHPMPVVNGLHGSEKDAANELVMLRTPSPQTPPLAGARHDPRAGSELTRSTLSIPFRIEDIETDRTSIDFNIESVLHTRGQSLAPQVAEHDATPTPAQAPAVQAQANTTASTSPSAQPLFVSGGTSEIHFVQEESLPANERTRYAPSHTPGTRATSIDIEFHEEGEANHDEEGGQGEEERTISPVPHIPLTLAAHKAKTTNIARAAHTARRPAPHSARMRPAAPKAAAIVPPQPPARKPALPPEATAPLPRRRTTNTNATSSGVRSAPVTARRVASAPRRPAVPPASFARAATATLHSPRKPQQPTHPQAAAVSKGRTGYDKPWRTNSAPVRPKAANALAPDPRVRLVRKASTPRFRHRPPPASAHGSEEQTSTPRANAGAAPQPYPRTAPHKDSNTAATRRGRDGYDKNNDHSYGKEVSPTKARIQRQQQHEDEKEDVNVDVAAAGNTPRAAEHIPRPHPATTRTHSHTERWYSPMSYAAAEEEERITAEEAAAWGERPAAPRVRALTLLAAEVQEWAEMTTQQKTLQAILSTARTQDRAIAATLQRIAEQSAALNAVTGQLYSLRDAVVQRRGADLTGRPLPPLPLARRPGKATTSAAEKEEKGGGVSGKAKNAHEEEDEDRSAAEVNVPAQSSPVSARLYSGRSVSSRSVSPASRLLLLQQAAPPQECSCLSDEELPDAELQSHAEELRAWRAERMRLREEAARLREQHHDLRFHLHRGTHIKPLAAMRAARSLSLPPTTAAGASSSRSSRGRAGPRRTRSPVSEKEIVNEALVQLRYEQQRLAAALTRGREEHHALLVQARRQRRGCETRLQAAMADRQTGYARWAGQVEQLREQRRRLAALTRSAERNVVLSPRSHRQALQRLREYTTYSDNVLARTEQRVRSV